MPDIAIVWNPALAQGDWATPAQEAGAGGDLAAAVALSLFTDRRATDDYVPTDGTTDRRGCWTDAFDEEPIGSRLWQLDRARRNAATLLQARDFCREALAWMLRDQVASSVDVLTFWAGRTALGIKITIGLPAGPDAVIDYTLPWGGSGGL